MEKVVMITGANSGIGKEAAMKFAALNCQVVMACRNIQSSQLIRDEIREKSGNMNVELLKLDIASKQSISSFCEAFKTKYDVLDILIHNAGHFKHGETSFQQNPDGMELTFSTNLLGPVLLSNLLLDVLAKSENPKILNACSTNIKHFFDDRRKIDFNTLLGQSVAGKRYNSYHIYGDSKMGLLMATFAMSQEYKKHGICVNALMIPATKMSKNTIKKFKSYWKLLAIVQNIFIPKAEVMGDAYISICTSKRYEGVTGTLINSRGEIVRAADHSTSLIKILTGSDTYPPYADDKEAGKRVWEICNRYCLESENDMNGLVKLNV